LWGREGERGGERGGVFEWGCGWGRILFFRFFCLVIRGYKERNGELEEVGIRQQ